MDHECQKTEIISEINRKIENFYAIKDVVIELKLLVNLLIDQNKRQDEIQQRQDDILKQQSEALIKISDTVIQQGELLKALNEKQAELDNKFIQKNIEELKQNSISLMEVIKDGIGKYLPPIVTAGLTYLILEVTK